MLPLRFVSYAESERLPHVVVDGSANAATVLALSHWPGSPTPVELRDDLSAQIAFHALSHPHLFDGVAAVTNNHFDQDGLCAMFALTDPDAACARRELLVDVASAGDFGVFRSRDAARIAFAIAALEDETRTPLDAAVLSGAYDDVCARLYTEALPLLPGMIDHPEHFRELWADEDAHLAASLDAIERGVVRIDERPDVDLAIVTVPSDWARQDASRFTQRRDAALHPAAVNTSTDRLRVLSVQGSDFQFELRYESWVMLTSRRPLPRPDLRDLAPRLTELEPGGAQWKASAPGGLTPRLEVVGGRSDLAPDVVVAAIVDFLATAPPAWDPFAPR